jgi:hypothetical protein
VVYESLSQRRDISSPPSIRFWNSDDNGKMFTDVLTGPISDGWIIEVGVFKGRAGRDPVGSIQGRTVEECVCETDCIQEYQFILHRVIQQDVEIAGAMRMRAHMQAHVCKYTHWTARPQTPQVMARLCSLIFSIFLSTNRLKNPCRDAHT